jgi:transcriptional regulator with XRE-family HTH domain
VQLLTDVTKTVNPKKETEMSNHDISPETAAAARKKLGLSQAIVSRAIGLNRSYLSDFESGKRILEDRWLDSLLEFFLAEGWTPIAPNTPSPVISALPKSREINPFSIADGFVIARPQIDDEAEELLNEYYENALGLELEWVRPLPRGIFGGQDPQDMLETALPALVLTARQYQIVRLLHGHSKSTPMNTDDTKDESTLQTVGDFITAHVGRVSDRYRTAAPD